MPSSAQHASELAHAPTTDPATHPTLNTQHTRTRTRTLSPPPLPAEDHRISFPEWGELKPSTPWGSLPVLTLADGQHLGQQRAIVRLVGKAAGLYPADALAAARCDELCDTIDDVMDVMNAVGQGLEKEAKEAARAEATEPGGAIAALFAKIEAFCAAHGTGCGHAVGGALTIADLQLFGQLGFIGSGFYDGVAPSVFDRFPAIQAVRKAVATHPAVLAWYDGRGDAVSGGEAYLRDCRDIE